MQVSCFVSNFVYLSLRDGNPFMMVQFVTSLVSTQNSKGISLGSECQFVHACDILHVVTLSLLSNIVVSSQWKLFLGSARRYIPEGVLRKMW